MLRLNGTHGTVLDYHFLTAWAKRQQLAAHYTNSISSLGCMVLGQELQEAIKKLEEEVLERAWRCGCYLVASMRGDRDVVETVFQCNSNRRMNESVIPVSIAELKFLHILGMGVGYPDIPIW